MLVVLRFFPAVFAFVLNDQKRAVIELANKVGVKAPGCFLKKNDALLRRAKLRTRYCSLPFCARVFYRLSRGVRQML